LFRNHAKDCADADLECKAAMLIGLVICAVTGGLAGVAWSFGQSHELLQVLAAYPVGGILAVLAFLLLTSQRSRPRQPGLVQKD
jgi:uncharacterized membrane protein